MGVGGGGSLPPVLTSLVSVPINSFPLDIPVFSHEAVGWQLLPLSVVMCLMFLAMGQQTQEEKPTRAQVLFPVPSLHTPQRHTDEELGASLVVCTPDSGSSGLPPDLQSPLQVCYLLISKLERIPGSPTFSL